MSQHNKRAIRATHAVGRCVWYWRSARDRDVAGFPWEWKNVAGLPRKWNKSVRDSRGNVALCLTFVVHLHQQEWFTNRWRMFTLILLTQIALLSVNWQHELIIYFRYSWGHNATFCQLLYKAGWKQIFAGTGVNEYKIWGWVGIGVISVPVQASIWYASLLHQQMTGPGLCDLTCTAQDRLLVRTDVV